MKKLIDAEAVAYREADAAVQVEQHTPFIRTGLRTS